MTQNEALEILKTGCNVFLTGQPGAGKTFTIERFIKWLEGQGKDYAITASTGIAASHIDGTTIHSWSGIKTKRSLTPWEIEDILGKKGALERMMKPDVLIVDEVSMMDGVLLDLVDRVLQDARGKRLPFGGLQVVLVGDFYQLPPVVDFKKEKELIFAYDSAAWKSANFTFCDLTEQYRQEDPEFLKILNAIRNGTITKEQKDRLRACKNVHKNSTQLYSINKDVDNINHRELLKLPGEGKSYFMSESFCAPDDEDTREALDNLKKRCLSPEELRLKVGAIVMFTRNNPERGYVNGTIGKVISLDRDMPRVETTDGRTLVPEIATWTVRDDDTGPRIMQVPLRLAWAITVHKSQGMSLDVATVDLSKAFTYGQGYVALSRVRSLAGLNLLGINEMAFRIHPKAVEAEKLFRSMGDEQEYTGSGGV